MVLSCRCTGPHRHQNRVKLDGRANGEHNEEQQHNRLTDREWRFGLRWRECVKRRYLLDICATGTKTFPEQRHRLDHAKRHARRASGGDLRREGSEVGGGAKTASDSSAAGCVKNEEAQSPGSRSSGQIGLLPEGLIRPPRNHFSRMAAARAVEKLMGQADLIPQVSDARITPQESQFRERESSSNPHRA